MGKVIVTGIEAFPLRLPFKPSTRSAVSAWGPKGLNEADSLLGNASTDDGREGWA